MKICFKCKENKELTEFHKAKKHKDGLVGICKSCAKDKTRLWVEQNREYNRKRSRQYAKDKPEIVNANNRRYKNRNKEHINKNLREKNKMNPDIQRNRSLKYCYGITLEDYKQMLLEQNNMCLICDRTQEELGEILCVDHNHITGKIRGLICRLCNKGLGCFRLDKGPNLLNRALKYYENTK